MKRKTIITIRGEDGEHGVDIEYKFEPPLKTKEETPLSGWHTATVRIIDFISEMVKEGSEDSALSKAGTK